MMLMPRQHDTRFDNGPPPMPRAAIFVAIVAVHGLLILWLLTVRDQLNSRRLDRSLAVFWAALPPEPAPEPPPTVPKIAKVAPAPKPGRAAANAPPRAIERVDATPVTAAPPAAASEPPRAARVDDSAGIVDTARADIGTGSGAGSGGGSGEGGGDGNGPAAKAITIPASWVWRPTLADMAEFNPLRNRAKARVMVQVVLTCRVKPDHRVENCDASHEQPMGYGAAEAALRSTRIFRVYPPRVNGKVVEGAKVTIPITFDNFER